MLYREIMAVCSEIHTKHINTTVWTERGIDNAFAKLRNATISFVMSVCPSPCNNLTPTGRIFMKFGIWYSSFIQIWHTNRHCVQTDVHLLKDLAEFFLKWEIFRTKVVEEFKTHFMFNNFSPPPHPTLPTRRKSCRLWDNFEIQSTAWTATDDSTAHAHCMLCN